MEKQRVLPLALCSSPSIPLGIDHWMKLWVDILQSPDCWLVQKSNIKSSTRHQTMPEQARKVCRGRENVPCSPMLAHGNLRIASCVVRTSLKHTAFWPDAQGLTWHKAAFCVYFLTLNLFSLFSLFFLYTHKKDHFSPCAMLSCGCAAPEWCCIEKRITLTPLVSAWGSLSS